MGRVIGVTAGRLTPGRPVDRFSPRTLPVAITAGEQQSPSVLASMYGVDIAELVVKINEGSLYPTATLTGTVQQQWETDLTRQALQQFNAFVQANVSVPIYQGGGEYSLIRQAKETVGQKRIDLDTARDAAQANVTTVWGQLEAAKAQILATQALLGESSARRAQASVRITF